MKLRIINYKFAVASLISITVIGTYGLFIIQEKDKEVPLLLWNDS